MGEMDKVINRIHEHGEVPFDDYSAAMIADGVATAEEIESWKADPWLAMRKELGLTDEQLVEVMRKVGQERFIPERLR